MSDKKRLVKSVLLGSLCGLLGCVILMCIFAAALLSVGLPGAELIQAVMIAIAALGALVGGFITAKCCKSAGLVVGAITGAVMFLLITVAGAAKGNAVSSLTAIRFAALLAGGMLGGVLGVREKKVI